MTSKPPSPTPRKIVAVTWDDIVTRADWVGDRETVIEEMKPMRCVSIGFLIVDNDEIVLLADTVSKDKEFSGLTVIPKPVVKEIIEVAKVTPSQYLK